MSRAASISFHMAIPPWETGTKSQAPTVKYKLLTSLKSIPNFERIRLRITFAARKAGWRGRKTFKACSFLRKASDRGVATGTMGHHHSTQGDQGDFTSRKTRKPPNFESPPSLAPEGFEASAASLGPRSLLACATRWGLAWRAGSEMERADVIPPSFARSRRRPPHQCVPAPGLGEWKAWMSTWDEVKHMRCLMDLMGWGNHLEDLQRLQRV